MPRRRREQLGAVKITYVARTLIKPPGFDLAGKAHASFASPRRTRRIYKESCSYPVGVKEHCEWVIQSHPEKCSAFIYIMHVKSAQQVRAN